MSRLEQLGAEIKQLPAKRQLATQANLLGQFAAKLTIAANSAGFVDDRSPRASLVFSPKQFEAVSIQREKLRVSASKMRSLFADSSLSLTDAKVQGDLTQISAMADSTKKKLNDLWSKYMDDEYSNWQPVAAFVAQLQGSQEILLALRVLQQYRSEPPKSIDVANKIKQQIDAVTKSLSSLHLTGKVKQFVEAALQGNAGAGNLLDPEIKKFIDDTQLWKVLTVKLGR